MNLKIVPPPKKKLAPMNGITAVWLGNLSLVDPGGQMVLLRSELQECFNGSNIKASYPLEYQCINTVKKKLLVNKISGSYFACVVK